MSRDLRRTLVLPTILAVTVLAAPGCPGDDRTTEAEAEAGSTEVVTDGDPATSGTDTGDTTGGLDCTEFGADRTTCQATSGCAWDPVLMSCVVDCYMLFDQVACEATSYCEWYGDSCHSPL